MLNNAFGVIIYSFCCDYYHTRKFLFIYGIYFFRYFELRPLYDRSQEKIRELESEVTKLKDELSESELRHQKMYLQMFLKGQQAAKLQAEDEQVRLIVMFLFVHKYVYYE